MLRLLIMCSILGLFGVLFEAFGAGAEPMDLPMANMKPMNAEKTETNMAPKSKRHYDHSGSPCPLSYEHTPGLSAYSAASVHQKPFVVANYQKPMVPKMIYQTIQRPAIHPATFAQPMVKHQVQYVQQPNYVHTVKEHPISYVKPAAPTISYENLHKLVTSYIKPVHENHQVQMMSPQVKEIPCDPPVSVVIQKPMPKPAPMIWNEQSYYPKQLIPISYHRKPMSIPKPIFVPSGYQHQSTDVLYHKPSPIAKIPVVTPKPEPCDEPVQKKISYVKVPQSIPQAVHVPAFQYAPKYHEPMFEIVAPKIQPQIIHVAPKIHQPVVVQQPMVQYAEKAHSENSVVQYAPLQPIVYGPPSNGEHYAAPPTMASHVDHQGHYQSPIIRAKQQPCDK
ncbi:cytadherence high molecular weight protein 3-like [Athalia rosae]|uniref:cytadherence high molecular weight protein 3-like n=1 Tax=Athalia rosae TaxID=37344 RepID=UPI002034836E|nr:cytadherence high molecular weight protein 3-like [Athalia rosae]